MVIDSLATVNDILEELSQRPIEYVMVWIEPHLYHTAPGLMEVKHIGRTLEIDDAIKLLTQARDSLLARNT